MKAVMDSQWIFYFYEQGAAHEKSCFDELYLGKSFVFGKLREN